MQIEFKNNNIYIKELKNFDLAQTLDCGQAFRWTERQDGAWQGIVYGRSVIIRFEKETLVIENMSEEEFQKTFRRYFDLDRDYGIIAKVCKGNRLLSAAAEYGWGIRILAQEPFEALCSFIISQNNNIPRIKGIIARLCENFGEKKEGGYAFPTANVLADKTVEDLAPLRSGFRAKYIIDAAQKVANGEVDLEGLRGLPYQEAQQKLMSIKGVGTKVADCTLLFGLGRIEAFPKDVWIKRVMAAHFPEGLPEGTEAFAGIIQQYLFYYARTGNI